jgi:hypothetical protein
LPEAEHGDVATSFLAAFERDPHARAGKLEFQKGKRLQRLVFLRRALTPFFECILLSCSLHHTTAD